MAFLSIASFRAVCHCFHLFSSDTCSAATASQVGLVSLSCLNKASSWLFILSFPCSFLVCQTILSCQTGVSSQEIHNIVLQKLGECNSIFQAGQIHFSC